MFNLFKRREQPPKDPTVLAECQKEMERTAAAVARFVSVPRDMAQRVALLERAHAAGHSEHETVKRLDYLQRLLTTLNDGAASAPAKDALLDEAKQYQFESISAVRTLAAERELETLAERGVQPIEQDSQGRAVYLRCEAEFKNKSGLFEVREDGVTFTGEVFVEVPWSTVAHCAKTTHTYQGLDYDAVALQEGKRRTPTKFVFFGSRAPYACEVTVGVWVKSKARDR